MRAILRTLVTVLLPGIVAAALWVAPACADVITDWNVTADALVANDVRQPVYNQCINRVGQRTHAVANLGRGHAQ